MLISTRVSLTRCTLARIIAISIGAVLLGAAVVRPCLADEVELQVLKRYGARPGEVVGLKVVRSSAKLDAATKIIVRLSTPLSPPPPAPPSTAPSDPPSEPKPIEESLVEESLVEARRVNKTQVQFTVPKPLRQGHYKVELMADEDQVLGTVPNLRIRAVEPPTISKIVPHPSYPVGDRHSFEIRGERFGQNAEDSVLIINDVAVKIDKRVTMRDRRGSIDDCERKFPCLVGNRRRLQVYGLSPTTESLYRPLRVSVSVDNQVSAEHPLPLSWVQRNTPIVIAFGVLGTLALATYFMIRGKAARYRPFGRRYSTFAYAFIDPETNTLSLSRLQLIAWTAAAVVAYCYVGASECLVQWQWQLPKVPDGLAPLLGVSVGTTALAAGASMTRGSKGAGPAHPGFGDFLTAGGALAPERLQFFVWTVLGVVGFLGVTLAQDPAIVSEAAKIPDNFLPLMGVSSLGYVAGKIVGKPGPIIRQLVPPPPYGPGAQFPGSIRIVGEHLSPRAMVWINRQLIPQGSVTIPPARPGAMEQSAAMEFVTDLQVEAGAVARALGLPAPAPVPAPAPGPAPAAAPAAAAPAPAPAVVLRPAPGAPAAGPGGVAMIRIVNPDGQSAEI
jgi:hypothetical protein